MVRDWQSLSQTHWLYSCRWWWWTWITTMLAENSSMTTLVILKTFYLKITTQEMFYLINKSLKDSNIDSCMKKKKGLKVGFKNFYWNHVITFLFRFMQLKNMYKIYIKSANSTFISFFVYTKTLWCRFWILFQNVHLRVWECFDVLYEAVGYCCEPNTTERSTGLCSR